MAATPSLVEALQAGLAPAPAPAAPPGPLLVAGAVGRLGAAVLEALLRSGRHRPVVVLASRPIEVAMAGLRIGVLPGPDALPPLPAATDTAVVVIDQPASRHGREAALLAPTPAQLPALGERLRAAGIRRLVLVLPHQPTLLPPALRAGLASLEEGALAAQGFEQLVLVRPARAAGGPGAPVRSLPARVARALLAQLHWMVPQREQPLRPQKVAEAIAALVLALPAARAGTRVWTPEALWDWAQPGGGERWLVAWLGDQPLPAVQAARQRW